MKKNKKKQSSQKIIETLAKTVKASNINEVESDYDRWLTREPDDEPRTPDNWYEDIDPYISSLYEQLTNDIDSNKKLAKIKTETINYLYTFMEEKLIPFVNQNTLKLNDETKIAIDSYKDIKHKNYIELMDNGILVLIEFNPKFEKLKTAYTEMLHDYRQEMGEYYNK